MDETAWVQKNKMGFFFNYEFRHEACVLFFFWHVLCLLTVDGESHSSGQVSVQVVVVQPLALVHAAVSALHGLEDQEAILAFNGFVLRWEDGDKRLNSAPNQVMTEEQRRSNTHVFVEVKLGLRVSVSLALHGDGVALLDRVSVDEDEGRGLRGIWISKRTGGSRFKVT